MLDTRSRLHRLDGEWRQTCCKGPVRTVLSASSPTHGQVYWRVHFLSMEERIVYCKKALIVYCIAKLSLASSCRGRCDPRDLLHTTDLGQENNMDMAHHFELWYSPACYCPCGLNDCNQTWKQSPKVRDCLGHMHSNELIMADIPACCELVLCVCVCMFTVVPILK